MKEENCKRNTREIPAEEKTMKSAMKRAAAKEKAKQERTGRE